jgi:hypothetical protein
MPLTLYIAATRRKEPFEPLDPQNGAGSRRRDFRQWLVRSPPSPRRGRFIETSALISPVDFAD